MRNEFAPTGAFVPRFGLAGGHRQTIAGAFLRPLNRLSAPEQRLFRVDEEAQVMALCHWQGERSQALTVVLVHGLEGSCESPYVVGTADKACQAGMNVVRLNVRNCGRTERLSPTLYHSGLCTDVREVVRALAEEGLSRIALAGFSMGGNQVLKLAGEWGGKVPPQLRAVAAVSPGIDLAVCADSIHWWRNRIYEWMFLWNLTGTLRRKAACFPGKFQPVSLLAVRSLRQFDDLVTAPQWGFSGADDYYARASAAPTLGQIAVPTLVIHARNDPFVPLTAQTRARLLANPNIGLVETDSGGHCAFLAAPDGYDGRWAERQVVNFLSRF